jgi:hypothetical protein
MHTVHILAMGLNRANFGRDARAPRTMGCRI